MEPGSAVSRTPWMLAAQPPGTQRLGLGGRNLSGGWMVAPSPFPDRGGVSRAGFSHSSCPRRWPWAAPSGREWTDGVSLEVPCLSDPAEAGAVRRTGWTHCPLHLRLPQKDPHGLDGCPVQPAGPSRYGECASPASPGQERGLTPGLWAVGLAWERSVATLFRRTRVTSRDSGGGAALTGRHWTFLEAEAQCDSLRACAGPHWDKASSQRPRKQQHRQK